MSAGGPVGNKVFAPIIFFIAFREALEASLVIGILLGMLESIVKDVKPSADATANADADAETSSGSEASTLSPERERAILIRKLRKLIFMGAFSGLFIAACIGAAFLAVFYTQANDLWGKAEELWEGIFNLIAVCLITPMSLAILRADRSRAKWSKKLDAAFRAHRHAHAQQHAKRGLLSPSSAPSPHPADHSIAEESKEDGAPTPTSEGSTYHAANDQPISTLGRLKNKVNLDSYVHAQRGALAIFLIPFVTTLREGLEGVVFIGGVSLGLPASSIPLPAIVGLACGFLCGYIVFRGGSFSKVKLFLILSTGFLLLIAAGMASRAVYSLAFYKYVQLVGDGAAESGDGPGSYYWKTYVWHFNCCNPEDKTGSAGGWALLNSIVGWNNTATVGSILMYVFYWLAVASYLIYACWQEGRLRLVLPSFSRSSSSSSSRRSGSGKVIWESGRAKTRRLAMEERAARKVARSQQQPTQHVPAPSLRVDA
ncbi:hypothetical protein OC844_007387 [Tilletia horrida]|nr:hypothetical protein OC844_007387 [Tilletia horrida]